MNLFYLVVCQLSSLLLLLLTSQTNALDQYSHGCKLMGFRFTKCNIRGVDQKGTVGVYNTDSVLNELNTDKSWNSFLKCGTVDMCCYLISLLMSLTVVNTAILGAMGHNVHTMAATTATTATTKMIPQGAPLGFRMTTTTRRPFFKPKGKATTSRPQVIIHLKQPTARVLSFDDMFQPILSKFKFYIVLEFIIINGLVIAYFYFVVLKRKQNGGKQKPKKKGKKPINTKKGGNASRVGQSGFATSGFASKMGRNSAVSSLQKTSSFARSNFRK